MTHCLVLIPGLLSDARVWAPLEAASAGLKVYRADVTKDTTIEAMAARVLAETAGKCVVVGHSMGGRVAMEVARQAPERVVRLVLANTGHHPLKDGEAEKRQAKIDQGHADFAAMVRDWLPPMVAASRHGDTELFETLTEMAMSVGSRIHERQIKALIARPDVAAYLPKILCPILLITGTEDLWSPEAQHREMLEMAQDAKLHVIENAGHFLPIEQPDAITEVITAWLKKGGDIQ